MIWIKWVMLGVVFGTGLLIGVTGEFFHNHNRDYEIAYKVYCNGDQLALQFRVEDKETETVVLPYFCKKV